MSVSRDPHSGAWLLCVVWSESAMLQKGWAEQHIERFGWRDPITGDEPWIDHPLCGMRLACPSYGIWTPREPNENSSRPTCPRCLKALEVFAREMTPRGQMAELVLDAVAYDRRADATLDVRPRAAATA